MRTILLLALTLVPALLTGCSSVRLELTSTVTKDSCGNLVIKEDPRRDENRNTGIPSFRYADSAGLVSTPASW